MKLPKSLFKSKKNKIILGFVVLSLLLLGTIGGYALTRDSAESETQPTEEVVEIQETTQPETKEETKEVTKTPEPAPEPEPQPEPVSQWPVTYSASQASSLTVVVNKKHRLPSGFAPSLVSVSGGQMRSDAAEAMKKLLAAAQNAGSPMTIVSSYRSYQTQVSTYQYWVDTQGQAQADRESARPGHSEHQTGLTADMGNPDGSCRLLACFGSGAAGKWLAAHAHEYGFIIRYQDGKESLTGYIYEPWHIRYLGISTATAVKNSGKTLDQYYGVEAGGY